MIPNVVIYLFFLLNKKTNAIAYVIREKMTRTKT